MNRQTIYLLTVWSEGEVDSEGVTPWRAVLEKPRTGQQWGFGDPKALIAFLTREHRDKSSDVEIDS